MTTATFLSCALDRAQVPDYSDPLSVSLDPDTIAGVSYHVTSAPAPSGELEHHPFALVDDGARLLAIPLNPTRELELAADSIQLLRSCFGTPR